MSFGGSTSQYPSAPKKPLGLPEDRMPSMEADQPWPWMCGTRRLGLIHLSERFDVEVEPVYERAKKTTVEVGKNVYVSQVAGLCLGLAGNGRLAVQRLRIDEEVIWEGPLYWNGTSERDTITVEGRGEIDIVWGSETQGIHPDLSALGHPAYRGKVYLVFRRFFCGYQQEQLPAVVVEFSRWPSFTWCDESNIEGDCNVAAILGDLMTHPRVGVRWPESRLNTTQLASLALRCSNDCLGLSPLVDSNESLQAVLSRIDEHIGGFTLPSADGRFAYELIREWPAADPVITLDEQSLLEEPDEDPQSADDTKTQVLVTYLSRDNAYKADYVTWSDPGNFAARAEARSVTLDRKWFTRPAAAQVACAVYGSNAALQDTRGSLRVRPDAIEDLELGDVFRHSYGHTGLCGLPLRCIAIEIPDPAKPEARVTYRRDRGHLLGQHMVPGDIIPPLRPDYSPAPLEHQTVLELPAGQPVEPSAPGLLILASRPTASTTTIRAHLEAPSGSYDLAGSGAPCRHGVLLEDYPAETILVDREVGFLLQLDGVDLTLPSLDVADGLANQWLAFIGGEIVSIFGATLLAPGQYRVQAVRARFDTVRATHLEDADVWIIPQSSLGVVQLLDQRAVGTVKWQPVAIGGVLDLSLCEPQSLSLTRRALRPQRLLNLRLNGQVVGATYSTGEHVLVNWSPVPDRKASYWTVSPSAARPGVRMMILDSTGALAATHDVVPGLDEWTYLNEALVANLGGETDFTIRAYQLGADGLVSTLYAERSITFV